MKNIKKQTIILPTTFNASKAAFLTHSTSFFQRYVNDSWALQAWKRLVGMKWVYVRRTIWWMWNHRYFCILKILKSKTRWCLQMVENRSNIHRIKSTLVTRFALSSKSYLKSGKTVPQIWNEDENDHMKK